MELPPIRIGMTPPEVRETAGAADLESDVAAELRAAGKRDSVPALLVWTYRDVPDPGVVTVVSFKDDRVFSVMCAADDEDLDRVRGCRSAARPSGGGVATGASGTGTPPHFPRRRRGELAVLAVGTVTWRPLAT